MTEIQNLQAMGAQRMTSLEIAKVTGKMHKNLMRDIRNMEAAWEKTTGLKFELSSYQDSTGRALPCYSLTKTECLYIATKFNDEARARLVIRWQQLEQERMMRGCRAYRRPYAHVEQPTCRRLHHHEGHRQGAPSGAQGPELVSGGRRHSEMDTGPVQTDSRI